MLLRLVFLHQLRATMRLAQNLLSKCFMGATACSFHPSISSATKYCCGPQLVYSEEWLARFSQSWRSIDNGWYEGTVLFILVSTPVNWNISKVIEDSCMRLSTWYQESCCQWAYVQCVAEGIASSHRYVIYSFRKIQKSPCRKLDIFGNKSQLIGGEHNSKNSDNCFIKIRWPSTEILHFSIAHITVNSGCIWVWSINRRA
jgi:hypothetical protein